MVSVELMAINGTPKEAYFLLSWFRRLGYNLAKSALIFKYEAYWIIIGFSLKLKTLSIWDNSLI